MSCVSGVYGNCLLPFGGKQCGEVLGGQKVMRQVFCRCSGMVFLRGCFKGSFEGVFLKSVFVCPLGILMLHK